MNLSEGRILPFSVFQFDEMESIMYSLAIIVLFLGHDFVNAEIDERTCIEKWINQGLESRFTKSQIQWMCQRWKTFQSMSSQGTASALPKLQQAYLDSVDVCQNGQCNRRNHQIRCKYPSACDEEAKRGQSDQPLITKSSRKEYRTLNANERQSLHDAFNRLKRSKIDGVSKYDLIASWHFPTQAPGAHWGPAFLPWHREYLLRMEIALKNELANVSIPYWDSTLDHDLPDPRDSMLWTEEYFGNGNGHVTTGPFADWSATTPLPDEPSIRKLYRKIGDSQFGGLMRSSDVDWMYNRRNYSQLTTCVDPTFELVHGLVHAWVGGYMLPISLSTNDPIFYFHHAYIDYLWERFRRRNQSPQERVSEWPPMEKICSNDHSLDAPMLPFKSRTNRQGLSQRYTQEWYEYQDGPDSCTSSSECRSDILWCHTTNGKCKAKIRPFGNCRGLEGTDACFRSKCNGICVPEGYTIPPTIGPLPTLAPEPWSRNSTGVVYVKIAMINEYGPLENGSVRVEYGAIEFSKQSPSPFDNAKFPEYHGLVYVGVPDPILKQVKFKITASNQFGQPCKAYCRRPKSLGGFTYAQCDGSLILSSQSEYSNPIAYSSSLIIGRFLDTDLSLHPQQWVIQPPYMGFLCGSANDPGQIAQFTRASSRTDAKSDYVWFHILVMDGRTPLDRSVPGAMITVISLDAQNPYHYESKVEDNADFPRYFGLAYVRAPNPAKSVYGKVKIHISAKGSLGRPCKPICDDGSAFEVCKGNVTLGIDEKNSDTFSFSSDEETKPLLGWDLTNHQSKWRRAVSILQFLCYID